MDGEGRFLQSVNGLRAVGAVAGVVQRNRSFKPSSKPSSTYSRRQPSRVVGGREPSLLVRIAERRGLGWLGVALLLGSTIAYGATLGGQWQELRNAAVFVPDAVAQGIGFRIDHVTVDGRKALTDAEIMEAIQAGGGQSLPFLDVKAARAELMKNPLVLDATIRKLYPETLAISIKERTPYALWQHDGKFVVIAKDGTPIDVAQDSRFADLPIVVGEGAENHAGEILAAIDAHPELHSRVYAAVRVGDRRWNLRLNNGVDVKLPQHGMPAALARFVKIEMRDDLSEKDITEVDMRIGERVTVRLSDEAAAAEEEARKKAKRGRS